ncbi:MAG: hypothetical protein IK121_00265, partial [Lachnospiraceae bacterium]|nr:hypothetical protein [Lachnospiraceae bacterium]
TEVVRACDALGLPRRIYVPKITALSQKEALVITPNHQTQLFIYSSYSERHIYGTDDATNTRRDYLIKKKRWGEKTFEVTLNDMSEMIAKGLAKKSDLE